MEQIFFYVILSVVVFSFALEQFLDYLNTTCWKHKLPAQLINIYNPHEYKKSQLYKKANRKTGLLSSILSFVIILLMLVFEGFAYVDSMAVSISEHSILTALLFFAIIGFASEILNVPFELYDTFVIEERFGFNKTTPRIFIFDKLKGLLITALLGGGILALVMWIWGLTGDMFWIFAWLIISAISIFFSMFYSTLIVPLFNKQTPLSDGELKQSIEHFAQKAGFKLDNVYVIDGSKRSSKANAYFTGLGSKKRIVLYDTLINDLSTNEVLAVLAHEIGHYKKQHIITGLIAGVLQTGLMLYVFSLFVSNADLSSALGVSEAKFHIGLIAFGILYSPFSLILGIGMNILSRKNEYEADKFAAQYELATDLASALKKLSVKNLSNLTPHKWYVFFHYSHPTLLQRLEKLNN